MLRYLVIAGWILVSVWLTLSAQELSRTTIPCLIAKLTVDDHLIDDREVMIAVSLWTVQSRTGADAPNPINDAMIIAIIDLWVRAADCQSSPDVESRK